VSLAPLLHIPFVNYLSTDGKYGGFIVDFFGNREIFLICVSMAVAALFELLIHRSGNNGQIRVAGILLILDTIVCSLAYAVLTDFSIREGQNFNEKTVIISITFLILTALSSSLSFIDLRRR
jgi:hypothetical protein